MPLNRYRQFLPFVIQRDVHGRGPRVRGNGKLHGFYTIRLVFALLKDLHFKRVGFKTFLRLNKCRHIAGRKNLTALHTLSFGRNALAEHDGRISLASGAYNIYAYTQQNIQNVMSAVSHSTPLYNKFEIHSTAL